jgi:hypothetical protein
MKTNGNTTRHCFPAASRERARRARRWRKQMNAMRMRHRWDSERLADRFAAAT